MVLAVDVSANLQWRLKLQKSILGHEHFSHGRAHSALTCASGTRTRFPGVGSTTFVTLLDDTLLELVLVLTLYHLIVQELAQVTRPTRHRNRRNVSQSQRFVSSPHQLGT